MAKTGIRNLIAACFCGCSGLIILIVSFSTEYWVTGDFDLMNNPSAERSEVNHGLFTGTFKSRVLSSTIIFPIVMTCVFDGDVCAWSCKGTEDDRYNEVLALSNAIDVNVTCTSEEKTQMGPNFQKNTSVEGLFLSPGLWVTTILFLSIAVLFNAIALGVNVWNTIGYPIEMYASIMAIYIYYGIAACSTFLALCLWGGQFGEYSSNNLGLTLTIAGNVTTSAELGYSYFLLLVALMEQLLANGLLYQRQYQMKKAESQNVLRVEDTTTSDAQTFMY